ncbi:MAG: T9SS type A sorting domain-containing protein [Cytophagaceae bacterium]|nr:T9SS type A sorting domain-containing protein [Cytophagaceae bacterium]
MKKLLLTNLLVLAGFVGAMAQNIAYNETFAVAPTAATWNGGTSYSTSVSGGMMNITMNDSIGPQQPGGPAANWNALTITFANAINMTTNKTIDLYIDNTGNADMTLSVQVQDNSASNRYTDAVGVSVAAGFVGTKTINYAGNFRNFYGASPGLVDSTNIIQINIQPVGAGLPAAPWSKKFKGNFMLDNFKVGGFINGVKAADNIASSQLYPNPATETAKIELELLAASEVKVTLSDMYGRQIAVIAEGKMISLEESFDVASFAKGLYTVNYFINGAPAKSELLMVK